MNSSIPMTSAFELLSSFKVHSPGNVDSGSGRLMHSLGTKVHGAFTAHPIPTIAIGLVVLAVLKSYLTAVFTPTPLNKVPGPWYARFTTLHLKYLFARGTIWKYVEDQHDVYGDVIRLGPRQVWIANKSAMKDILLTTDLPKVTMYAEISRDRYGPGLFGEIRPKPHRVLKRFLGPAFTVTSVDKLDSFFKACTAILLRCYYSEMDKTTAVGTKPQVTTDLMRDLHCLALDIMGESAFGKGFGQIENIFDPSKITSPRDKAWSAIPNAIFDGLADRYRFVFIKRTLRAMGIDLKFDWPKSMTTAISELVDERREESEQSSQTRIDVLQHMLDEGNRPDTGTPMSNQEIIDQMSELLLAGSETTSGTLGCLFLSIARNPEVRAKLLASLPVLTPEDGILDSKTVREGKTYEYLEACIKENLRMYPIASEMGRRTLEQGMVAGDYEIPPYTVVSASYRHLHRDERYWPKAHKFWPERWLEGDAREGAPEPDMDSYFPFSSGKHSCIGQNFAYAEIRTVSANILSRFDIEEAKFKDIDFRQFITMQMHDGSWNAILKPRWT